MHKTLIFILLISNLSCSTNRKKVHYSIKGNWSTLIDSVYNEICFREDTLEIFNNEWAFLPPSIYKINKDSLILKSSLHDSTITKYKIMFIDSLNVVMENPNTRLILKKIPDNQYTMDDLINNGYFNYGVESLIPDSLRNDFIDSAFRIREVNYLIENKILNKDTLLNFWNSQLTKDSSNLRLYLNLIKNVK